MPAPTSPPLSPSQHAPLTEIGEEPAAPAGEGVLPCTEWLHDAVVRDRNGLIITRAAANADMLETDPPGVLAAGDVRSGSTKRCATAVSEGAIAVQFVHAHLARTATIQKAR